MELERKPELEFGVLVSVIGHALIAYLFYYGVRWDYGELGAVKIYSVTMEGGTKLGAISQVPKKDDKAPVAPPKNVQEPAKKEEPVKAVEEKKPDPKPVEKEDPTDAEVSLKEKEKEKEKKEEKPVPPKQEVKKEEQKVEKKEEKKVEKKPEKPPPPKELNKAERDKRLQQAMQRYLGESSSAGGAGFGAAAVGGKSQGGGIVRGPEFFEYKNMLERTIKGGWRWYDQSSPLISQVVFKISPRGEISEVQTTKSSGNSEFDQAAERAVMKASPLPPPPPSVYQDFAFSRMTFDPRE